MTATDRPRRPASAGGWLLRPAWPTSRGLLNASIAMLVLLVAALMGWHASRVMLVILMACLAVTLALRFMQAVPALALLAIVGLALLVPVNYNTRTAVSLNSATVLVPALAVLAVIGMLVQRRIHVRRSRTTLPLLLFLAAGLLAWVVGNATWDPAIPRSDHFALVQLGQWCIFAFAACAFWLSANLLPDGAWLRRFTFFFLAVAGGLAVLRVLPGGVQVEKRIATLAIERAPFWALLCAVAGGQLLFNRALPRVWQAISLAAVIAALIYAFRLQDERNSNWVGVGAAVGVLLWLRFPRLRIPIILVVIYLAASGILWPTIYNFAGGAEKWDTSGAPRLVLIQRVLQVTARNPITGLGPAAYRPYTALEPLTYGHAYWVQPQVNSHNNYVDIYSHTGLMGLALFMWFMIEVGILSWRMHRRYPDGFAGAYASAMFATWVAALILMLLADWILPFVYNISFPGFQASVLVWLFLGGLVVLDSLPGTELRAGAAADAIPTDRAGVKT